MTITYRLGLYSFAFCLLFACSKDNGPDEGTPPAGKSEQKDFEVVDDVLEAFMAKYDIPGASLAVSKNEKLVYAKGYGYADLEAKEKVTPDHQFRLASVSKTYTGVAVMSLVQEGKLSLSDHIFGDSGILGNLYGTLPYNSNLRGITVADLLLNTSGSWGGTTGGDVIDQHPNYTNDQFLDWVVNTRPNPQAPGTVYDYSNVGFWLAGRVIEQVSGKSYGSYVRDMVTAHADAIRTELAGKTLAERKKKEVKYYGQGNDAAYVYNIAFPRRDADGGWISTASDVLRFITSIDGMAGRTEILNSVSLKALTTPSAVSTSYAMGIGVWADQNLVYNYGSLPGTRTGFMRDNANGMSAVLLLNSRVDPTVNEVPFVQEMQNILLSMLKSNTIQWQSDIDQF
ncbi:serine hydrolase domain-containing protein [Parapedobacter sp. 2B3]|uniref:serine hydrolase domain-containing protein n=1 Tax=Parapedobacter sp. 2B3 TaxID=3342381 RepID=UPI0035B63DAB